MKSNPNPAEQSAFCARAVVRPSHNDWSPPALPATGYLRLPQVLAVFPVSRSTWWAGVRSGRYPKAVKLGERCTAWRAEDIRTLIDAIGREAA